MRPIRAAAAISVLGLPTVAAAHGFGRLYNLPVPFWLYGWAAASVLVVSFLLAAYFIQGPAAQPPVPTALGTTAQHWLRRLRSPLQGLALLLWALCLATAWWGSRDPYRNFSMTFFWVVFLLGYTYLTALLGNSWAVLNPWRTTTELIARVWPGLSAGRFRYPPQWGDWPALVLYLGFIWFELFGLGKPGSLARALTFYSALNLVGVWLIGSRAWFTHGEFFSVFLRLTGLMGVLHRGTAEGATWQWRRPFSGLVQERPWHVSSVVFVLAMLSTTAFDGLRATQWWVRLFWFDTTGWLTPLLEAKPFLLYAQLRPWYIAWETLVLMASPFLYFAAYLGCITLAKVLTRSSRSIAELSLDFGYSLLPIALVYHLTHYSTLLLTQGLKIVSLFSDPFGRGWNVFGTAELLRAPILPEMSWVWHSQVGLILLGHIISVALAHRVALQVFPNRRDAALSQLPMLILMVAFTVAGLWIIAQPLTDERMM
jgi:hypothetical protein